MFTFNGKQYKIITDKFYKENKTLLIKSIELSLINFIEDNYAENFDSVIRYIIKHSISSVNEFKVICISEFGNFKKINKYGKFVYNDIDHKFLNGSAFRGKKRPEHSLQLKGKPNHLNRKENWSDARIDYHNNFMNSNEWRKQILIKKGFIQSGGFTVHDKNRELKTNETLLKADLKIGDEVIKYINKKLLIKIDVEGHEINALKGLNRLIKNNKIYMQIEIFHENKKNIFNFLEKNDFKFVNNPISLGIISILFESKYKHSKLIKLKSSIGIILI